MRRKIFVKKMVTVVLATAMLAGTLAGCGSSGGTDEGSTASMEGSSDAADGDSVVSAEAGSDGADEESSSGSIAGVKDNGDGTYTVTVAVLDGMAPYTYTDENGEFQGYDYKYMLALDEKLDDYTFEYVAASPDAAPAAIQAGTYAMSVSAHFVTPARAENYLLSIPQSYYPINLVSRKEDSFTKFEDLDGKLWYQTRQMMDFLWLLEIWHSSIRM
ncbi:MAG: transporter substrate-binding domain-containing protein [Lachnospiraceae bacterium]|nr:transporter substrate-binding domain-containing protein [Lachnospiraceae bacterium]